MVDLKKLRGWIEDRPFVILRFGQGYHDDLMRRAEGIQKFTIAQSHESVKAMKLPTLCLVEFTEPKAHLCFIGVIRSKSAVTTFDSRLSITRLRRLEIPDLESIGQHLKRKASRTMLNRKLSSEHTANPLSKKLALEILEFLLEDPVYRTSVEAAALHLPRFKIVTAPEWEQGDAVKTALAVFGLTKDAIPEEVELSGGSETALRQWEARVLEDYVISYDAQNIPSFIKDRQDVTGRAVFRKGDELLTVYTANRGPLEKMLGVDLIYINEIVGNIVMVQYKMLEERRSSDSERVEWIFRPDAQLTKEISRMYIPATQDMPDDYRIHSSPFFFKFVQRKGDGESHRSFVVSLDHLNWILDLPETKGQRGGTKLDYQALRGVYLRETDLLALIRSGYIGTHRLATNALHPLIARVAQGDRSLVVAWQQSIQASEMKILRRGES